MNNGPTFSVIIPAYNRGDGLRTTIDSVLSQTYVDFELIIVDDGSTDNTRKIVEGIDDNRIRYIFQNNEGASKARNTGIEFASGKYVAFLDSDDVFLSHHLENALPILKTDTHICIYTQIIVDRGDGLTFLKPPRALLPGEDISEYLMCQRGFVQTSTLFVPQKIAAKIRYDEELSYGQDTDFAIRLINGGVQLQMLQEPGVIWKDRWDEKRLSSTINPHQRKAWLNRVKPIITKRAYWADMGWNVAKGYTQNGMFLKGAKLYLQALLKGCYKPKFGLVVFLQVVLPPRMYRKVADMLAGRGVKP